MHLGIDASNIRAGGGVTHLVELLGVAEPALHGFKRVIVWGGTDTLQQIEDRPWLIKVSDPLLDQSLPERLYWQRFLLDHLAHQAECEVLFVPGGTYSGTFQPFVTMSQNLLPFDRNEARRYGISWMFLKLQMLRKLQSQTMRRAGGVVFLTDHAREVVMRTLKQLDGPTVLIPHGINNMFDFPPRPQYGINHYSPQNAFCILYVSTVTVYKHQRRIAEAVAALRNKGLPVNLELVGSAYPPALRRLRKTLMRLDPGEEFIRYRGLISHDELHKEYKHADAFVFASSCETFGQIVTEAMSAGLPIASSNTGTMRELLADSALYFNLEKQTEITEVLEKLIKDPSLRAHLALGAYQRAQTFTWERCARATFDFIAQVVRESSS